MSSPSELLSEADASVKVLSLPYDEPLDLQHAMEWFDKHITTLPDDCGYLEVKELIVAAFKAIEWTFFPFKLSGEIIGSGMVAQAVFRFHIWVPGIGFTKLVSASGSLVDGVRGSFNVAIARGFVRLFLKGMKEVWLQVNVQSPLGSINKEFKLFSF